MKKTMKKLSVLLLAFCLLLCACGGKNQTENVSVSTTEAKTTMAQTEAPTTEPAPTEPQIVFEPITVAENDECKIEITAIDPKDYGYFFITVKVENCSDTKTLYFDSDILINGVQFNLLFYSSNEPKIAAGKKAIFELGVSNEEISAVGITRCSDIALIPYVWLDGSRGDYETLDTSHVYPYGEELAETFVREPQTSDLAVMDDERATILITGYGYGDNAYGKAYNVDFYIVNKMNTVLKPQIENFYINDYACSAYLPETEIAPNCSAFLRAGVYKNMLDSIGVTGDADIEAVEFSVKARDEHWKTLFDAPVSLTSEVGE